MAAATVKARAKRIEIPPWLTGDTGRFFYCPSNCRIASYL
jgi:hypothetical protein